MKKPFIIGIAGGTGSGKSTVVEKIKDTIDSNNIEIILHDYYYKDRSGLSISERHRTNYDHPDALETELLVDHLYCLLKGNCIEVPIYDYRTHTRKKETRVIKPVNIIIVEGILILNDEKLRSLIDLKVFVVTDDDIRFIRRLMRDIEERGRSMKSVVDQYINTVKPMHNKFVEPSKQHADIIIPEGGYNSIAIDVLVTKLKNLSTL